MVTLEMARAEGWSTKNGSKWKTMPELMLMYRSASMFGRLNAPDILMGMYDEHESADIDRGREEKEVNTNDLNAEILAEESEPVVTEQPIMEEDIFAEGEVLPKEAS